MPDERYEINHNGEIVVGDVALCEDQGSILNALFSQFNHTCSEIEHSGSYRQLEITDANGSSRILHIFSGTVRNESRNPYEKKMQLGPNANPKQTDKHDTLILGIYVYQANDSIQDAIFVGYPVDDNIRYDTNPSLRGVFVNQLLVQAKSNGFVYDSVRNTAAFRAEFIYYYLANHYSLHYENREIPEVSATEENLPSTASEQRADNILLYGVPGSGKSYKIKQEYCSEEQFMERIIFHPDYTYSDFVGQILPQNVDGKISYPFIPGPFTRILKKAVADNQHRYYLIIEEINRGNAPAIFGEVFQLLDRASGESEYGINNPDIAREVYGDATHPVRIPSNLFLLATMNTADQNVFTLDTAFKRRWKMKSIPNDISKCAHADDLICGTSVSWKDFLQTINDKIIEFGKESMENEDKRLGVFFLSKEELSDIDAFSEKIFMYLWNDAFKYSKSDVFKSQYKTLEQLINGFKKEKFSVFSDKFVFKNYVSDEHASN